MKDSFKFAFKLTLPVLFGYLFLGGAFGLLLAKAGYSPIWAFFSSLVIYAGSAQFVLVTFLSSGLNLLSVALTTLSINSRHIFYGISFLDKFSTMGKKKYYMIFSLTDETYSLLASVKVPPTMNQETILFLISILNHSYWIIGGVIGAIAGNLLPLNITGVEFSMTALFTVIFLDQWKAYSNHIPVYLGIFATLPTLYFFGPSAFILPALLVTVTLLLVFRNQISQKEDNYAN